MRSLRSPFGPDFDRTAAADLASAVKAVADASRLQLLSHIAAQPRSNTELEQILGLSQSVVAHHLRILTAAGLILSRRNGAFILRSLDAGACRQLVKLLTPAGAR